jgi:hypothetical protein
MSGARPTIEFNELTRGLWGTFLYGSPRSLVDRLAYAMARANDANPTWVEIRDATGAPDPGGPSEQRWIPEERLFYLTPSEAMPQDAVANMAMWTVIRADEPRAVVATFTDFLRLPPAVQEAVSQVGRESSRPVLVVANSDRVRDYYPKEALGVRPIIDAMLSVGVLPVFASVGPPGAGRAAFDFVFEVEAPDLEGWREGSLVCHKAPPGSPVPVETRIPLPAVSQAVEFLDPKFSPPPRNKDRGG